MLLRSTSRRYVSSQPIFRARPLELLVLAFAVAFSFYQSSVTFAQTPLTPQESRGKQIYLQGTSASGKEIFAYIGESSLEVPGSTMACANCHGFTGQGKPEGGIDPSNITWQALTKPYGVTHPSGRKHPAYTDRGLELAIARGVDPAGNKLLNVMPRYQMSKEDLADLVLYLKRLGTESDPGITDDRIVIGTVLPPKGQFSEMGQAVKEVLAASFAELNAQGGVYNRKLELKFIEPAETPSGTRAAIERLIKDEKIFAMAAVFMAGLENEVIPLLAEQEVPLIGPLTLDPKIGAPLNRQVFYLLSGSPGQARALINFLARQPSAKSQALAVVYTPGELNGRILDDIKKQAQQDGLKAPVLVEYRSGDFNPVATVKQLKESNAATVFFLGQTTNLLSFMTEAAKIDWFPQILLPSGGVAPTVLDAPAGFDGKLFFTFPSTPDDQTTEALKEYRSLVEKYNLPRKHPTAQISAYAAAKVLIEALKRVGKDVSRERLIQALEGFYEYKTGLTPAITWGPNRRIGAMGAYVVSVNLKTKQFVPASGWISIN